MPLNDPTPPSRACRSCGEDLMRAPHATRCPARADVLRVSLDAEGKRMEDLLAACTRRALSSWVASGRAP